MMTTVFRKQWMDMGGRVWTYPLVAFCLLLTGFRPVLLGVVTGFLALDLAVHLAGDDARHGTFEFIFTRAVDRRAYLRWKYFFGVPLLVLFVALVWALEAVGVRDVFWSVIQEPLVPGPAAGDPTQPPLATGMWFVAAASAVFLFSLAFAFITMATSSTSFYSLGLVAVLVFLAYGAVVVWALAHAADVVRDATVWPWWAGSVRSAALGVAFFAVPAVLLYFFSRELYARRSLPPLVVLRETRSQRSLWLGVIILILLGLMVLMVFMTVPAPVDTPR